jgi:hypothetical protein
MDIKPIIYFTLGVTLIGYGFLRLIDIITVTTSKIVYIHIWGNYFCGVYTAFWAISTSYIAENNKY